jgi:hypothetical protein
LFWSCVGWINIKDTRSKYEYKAHFDGKPDLKILVFDTNKLKNIEELTEKDYKGAQKLVDNMTEKITWDNI